MIFEKLCELLSEQFNVEPESITMETTFDDLSADSVDLVELSMALEEEFGIDEMSEDDVAKIKNVGDLVAYLQDRVDE
ncbi:MAG TPA: acyl carrier protein [Candidatus Galloscillospira excrementavium]|nr:acyl carrier protein [Candidatus Galloscillospira excrementavium]